MLKYSSLAISVTLNFIRILQATNISPALHVLRVCDGPTCCKYSTEIYTQLLDTAERHSGLFEVAYSPCLSACKRSCNVALVPKGDFAGCYVPGMTSVERVKSCFSSINQEIDINRVLNLVIPFLKNENNLA